MNTRIFLILKVKVTEKKITKDYDQEEIFLSVHKVDPKIKKRMRLGKKVWFLVTGQNLRSKRWRKNILLYGVQLHLRGLKDRIKSQTPDKRIDRRLKILVDRLWKHLLALVTRLTKWVLHVSRNRTGIHRE